MTIGADWDAATPVDQKDWDAAAPQKPAAPKSRPLPANAGMVNFLSSAVGTPVDAVENTMNLTRAAQGTVAGALGRTDFMPPILQGSVGGSDWIRAKLRGTGISGLNPDNPNPEDAMGTAQYTAASRGAMVPGMAIPALASMAAEKVFGPQWAGVGAMTPAAAGQAVRMASPKPTPQTALLAKEGVELTPGQKYGGAAKRAEDAATSVPVLGDAIKSAQRRGVESFDTAAINRGLAPLGEKLPKGLTGNKAVDYAYGKLGDAYDGLLPKLSGRMDGGLMNDLRAIRIAGNDLPEPQRGQLNRIIEREVVARFNPQHGTASGQAMKDIESKLGGIAKRSGLSDDYDIRTMGESIKDAQAAVRKMVERANPAYQGELAKINDGYANFKIVQRAASNPAAPEGVFTPGQLHSAVRAKDSSKDKARFAEGGARMQDLSAAGKAVLPSSVPDSGTMTRAAVAYAASHPLKAIGMGIPIAAATLPYTRVGQGVLSGIASGQPPSPSLQALLQSILANQQ